MARAGQVGDGIYRISTTVALGEGAFQFNQFLIDDERPALRVCTDRRVANVSNNGGVAV